MDRAAERTPAPWMSMHSWSFATATLARSGGAGSSGRLEAAEVGNFGGLRESGVVELIERRSPQVEYAARWRGRSEPVRRERCRG